MTPSVCDHLPVAWKAAKFARVRIPAASSAVTPAVAAAGFCAKQSVRTGEDEREPAKPPAFDEPDAVPAA